MILSYLLKFIKGFVRFEISGKDAARFFNLLMKENIYIWDVSKIEDKFYVNISIKNYLFLPRLSRGYKVKIKVKERYGLPFVVNKYKKRIGIVAGVCFFISFLFVMSQFIWAIEINGNNNIDIAKLEKFVASKNIAPGKFRKNLDIRSIERDVLLNFKDIAWVAINIEGSKATININEVDIVPPNINKNEPCNIVAAKQGTIKRVEAYCGQNLTDIGDFVKEGQILVSGIMEDKSLNNILVHARAKALATVEKNIKYSQLLGEKKMDYKDISTSYYLKMFDTKIPLNFVFNKDKNTKEFYHVIYPKVFNISLPFNIIKCNHKQQVNKYIKLSVAEAQNKLLKKISKKETEMALCDIKIISKEIIKNELVDDKYIMEIKYITEEDIAKQQAIELG